MTTNNVENLRQVKKNIIIAKNSGANFFIHEKAPRQLLVNESVLRRNQMYR